MDKGLPRKILDATKAMASRKITINCDGIPFTFQEIPLKKMWNWMKDGTPGQIRTAGLLIRSQKSR